MNRWSNRSLANRSTCDDRLKRIFDAVLEEVDCTWICGHRNEKDQNEAFRIGNSEVKWPNSFHNRNPSAAADVLICGPIDWDNYRRNTLFAGVVLGVASQMGIPLVWGGDWQRTWRPLENKFQDLAHFELKNGG